MQSVKELSIPLLNTHKLNNGAWMVVELFSKEDLDHYVATPTILNGVKWCKAWSYQSYSLQNSHSHHPPCPECS